MRPRPGIQWDRRIERARELANTRTYAAEILGFYGKLTAFQKDFYLHIQSAFRTGSERNPSLPAALDEADLALLMRRWSPFLAMIAHEAPTTLADFACDLNNRGSHACVAMLRSCWAARGALGDSPIGDKRTLEPFCARAFLQPHAEYLAERAKLPELASRPGVCPYCGSPPLAGVLRQEGDGAAKSLVCSFCSTEWPYLRIACPACDERDEKKMCVYTSAAFDCVRIEACNTCRSYIKTVDLTKDGRAVPEVDELAAMPLTLWAEENGYSKPAQNVLGL